MDQLGRINVRIKLLIILLIIIAIPVVQFVRPLPTMIVQADTNPTTTIPGTPPTIQWPAQGESALEAVGIGEIGHAGGNIPLPIASVTKVMTAYLVLKKYPLGVGVQGPTVTVTPKDVQVYQKDLSEGQSVMKVVAGEKLSERKLLEGLLLPSGNNIAYILADWIAGSQSAFVAQMNQTAKELGMTHTHYVDASGYNPASASTAQDLLKITAAAMQNVTFRDITGMAQATEPVAGIVYNVDNIVGHGGIIGGKTGSTTQAGGCFVFASYRNIGGRQVMIVGAVLGQNGAQPLAEALNAGISLSKQGQKVLSLVHVVSSGDTVAKIVVPWQNAVQVQSPETVQMVGWPGLQVRKTVISSLQKASRLTIGQAIGTLKVAVGQEETNVPLTAPQSIPGPSYLWRLKRL